jgi:hypothetical protein
MSASERSRTKRKAGNNPCYERIAAESERLFRDLNVTDDDLVLQVKILEIKKRIDDINTIELDRRLAYLSDLQQDLQQESAREMMNEDLRSQLRELNTRVKILTELMKTALTPAQQQQLIVLAEQMKTSNQYDDMIRSIEELGFDSGISAEFEIFKQYLRTQSERAAQMASNAANFVSNEGRSGFYLLMALICSLPCKDNIIQLLSNSFPSIAALFSDTLCMYWKLEALKILKIKYDNLNPQDIDRILWALLGVTASVNEYTSKAAELCEGACILFYARFTSIMRMGARRISDIIFRTGQGISGALDLSGTSGLNVFSPGSSPKARSESSSDSSFRTAESQLYNDPLTTLDFPSLPKDVQQAILEAMSEATEPDEMEASSSSSEADKLSIDLQSMQNYSQESTGFTPRGTTEFLNLSGRRGKQKLADLSNLGNLGGRKSRRYKKKRSTLKRRGLKRRMTRKGKKRRHTKKRR